MLQGSQADRMARGQLLLDTLSLPSEEASYKAALCLLRGRVYAAMENQTRACLWYQAALQLDPFCYEAFQVCLLSAIAYALLPFGPFQLPGMAQPDFGLLTVACHHQTLMTKSIEMCRPCRRGLTC